MLNPQGEVQVLVAALEATHHISSAHSTPLTRGTSESRRPSEIIPLRMQRELTMAGKNPADGPHKLLFLPPPASHITLPPALHITHPPALILLSFPSLISLSQTRSYVHMDLALHSAIISGHC